MHKKLSYGFTLMELMVVMAILGVIIAISTNSFLGAKLKSRDAKRKNDLVQVSRALELYYNDHGRYPADGSGGHVYGCGASSSSSCEWGEESFEDQYNNVYLEKMPSDPLANSGYDYVYRASGDGLMYQLFARLENDNDPSLDIDNDGDADEYSVNCGNGNCNFAITSPNTNGTEAI
jgi:type II secretion system protein G